MSVFEVTEEIVYAISEYGTTLEKNVYVLEKIQKGLEVLAENWQASAYDRAILRGLVSNIANKIEEIKFICKGKQDRKGGKDEEGEEEKKQERGEKDCPTTFKPEYIENAIPLDRLVALDEPYRIIYHNVMVPLIYADVAQRLKLRAPNVLLYGPGGTGKTTLIRTVAQALGRQVIIASAADIKGSLVGQSEKCFQEMLDIGRDIDGIVFVDEIDTILAGENEIPKQFQGAFKQLVQTGDNANMPPPVLMGATNMPWAITDAAIQRRFGLKLLVPLPNPDERIKYVEDRINEIKTCPGELGLQLTNEQRDELQRLTRGFSQDDLRRLIQTARRQSRYGLGNVEDLRFQKNAAGNYDIYLDNEAPPGSLTLEEVVERNEDHLICWRTVNYTDLTDVIASKVVAASNDRRTITQFLEYAESQRDETGIAMLQATLAEFPE